MYRSNPRADAERVSQVLAGMVYPAAKWQLIMQAEEYGADGATRAQLWALPPGVYRDLRSVLRKLAAAGEQHAVVTAAVRRRSLHPVPGRVRPLR